MFKIMYINDIKTSPVFSLSKFENIPIIYNFLLSYKNPFIKFINLSKEILFLVILKH